MRSGLSANHCCLTLFIDAFAKSSCKSSCFSPPFAGKSNLLAYLHSPRLQIKFMPMSPTPLFLRRRLLAGLVSLAPLCWWRNVSAQVGSGGTGITQNIGSADLVIGNVTLRRAGQPPSSIAQGAQLLQGDQIETVGSSEIHVTFGDGGYLAVRPNSTVRIAQYVVTGESTDSATIDLVRGALRSVTGWIGKLDVMRYTSLPTQQPLGCAAQITKWSWLRQKMRRRVWRRVFTTASMKALPFCATPTVS